MKTKKKEKPVQYGVWDAEGSFYMTYSSLEDAVSEHEGKEIIEFVGTPIGKYRIKVERKVLKSRQKAVK